MKPFPLVAAAVIAAFLVGAPVRADDDNTGVSVRLSPRAPDKSDLRYRLLPAPQNLVPADAAQVYLLAFGQHDTGFAQMQEMLESSGADFPVEKARQFLNRGDAATALEYLDLAGRRQFCNWQLPDLELGFTTHAFNFINNNAQWYGQLVTLRTRVAVHDGRVDDVMESLRTGLAMSRHVSRGAPLSQALDGLFVQAGMLGVVRDWMARPESPNLYWPLVNLPRRSDELRPAVEAESRLLYRTLPGLERARRLSAAESREILMRLWSERRRENPVVGIVEMMRDYPVVKKRVVDEKLLPADEAESMPANSLMLFWYEREYRTAMEGLAKYLALPPSRAIPAARRALDEALKDDRPSNPLVAMLPRFPDAIAQFAVADRNVAVLATLESIRAYAAAHDGNLPPTLAALPADMPAPADPLTGRAFEYSVTGGSAVLTAPAPYDQHRETRRVYKISITR